MAAENSTAQTLKVVSDRRLVQAKLTNPIIGCTTDSTLFNAACAAACVARFHNSASDALAAVGHGEMDSNDHRGLSLLAGCIASALFFEVEGRE